MYVRNGLVTEWCAHCVCSPKSITHLPLYEGQHMSVPVVLHEQVDPPIHGDGVNVKGLHTPMERLYR